MRNEFSEPILSDLQLKDSANLSPGAPVHSSTAIGVTMLRANEVLHVEAKPAARLARYNSYSYLSLIKLQRG